ncbi:MAG: sulfatase [Planctomycetota bacterium]
MATETRLPGNPSAVLWVAMFPAALLGATEAVLLVCLRSSRPRLDLDVVPFAAVVYTLFGALAAVPILLACRAWNRPAGRVSLVFWFVFLACTDFVRLGLEVPLGTGQGMLVFGVGIAVFLMAFALLGRARKAPPRGSGGRSRPGAGLAFVLGAAVIVPPILSRQIFRVEDLPARTARAANAEGPPAPETGETPGPPSPKRPDVILITLDTTRADHLSAYGYFRDTTPVLEAFAKEAIRFDLAWSTSSWTVPSHASLLTGLFPFSHGARYKTAEEQAGEPDLTSALHHTWIRPLDPAHLTLAEALHAAGYRTAAFVGGPYLRALFGMAQGFDWYDDRMVLSAGPSLAAYYWLNRFVVELEPDIFRFGHAYRRGDDLDEAVFSWLDRQGDDRFFLFVNYFDAHQPYWPVDAVRKRYPGWERPMDRGRLPELFREVMRGEHKATLEELEWLHSQYDAELRFQDQQLGRLFDRLRAAGRFDEALIIVTADHGENLGEHGRLSHGFSLDAPETLVPLLVKFPRSDGRVAEVREDPVSLVDVLPTVAERLQLPAELFSRPLQGTSLLDRSGPHVVLGELYRDQWRVERFGDRFSRQIRSWIDAEGHLLEITRLDRDGKPTGQKELRLYDPRSDPLEVNQLAGDPGYTSLRDALHRWLKKAPPYRPSSWLLELDRRGAGAELEETGYAGD